uniref:hypothetical protein n=1 Tax=Ningiella ruwaisensis TaxID=2364274 RepID=UPI00109F4FE8|nr:hypothetical protein [Ningiella ruwaisensis]
MNINEYLASQARLNESLHLAANAQTLHNENKSGVNQSGGDKRASFQLFAAMLLETQYLKAMEHERDPIQAFRERPFPHALQGIIDDTLEHYHQKAEPNDFAQLAKINAVLNTNTSDANSSTNELKSTYLRWINNAAPIALSLHNDAQRLSDDIIANCPHHCQKEIERSLHDDSEGINEHWSDNNLGHRSVTAAFKEDNTLLYELIQASTAYTPTAHTAENTHC